MKVKVVISTREGTPPRGEENRAEIWSGEIELKRDEEYLTKVSFISEEGELHPVVDIPFALDIGYWQWRPAREGMVESDEKRSYD